MKINEVKQNSVSNRSARFSPKYPGGMEEALSIIEKVDPPRNLEDYKEKIKTLLDLERYTKDDPDLLDAIKHAYEILANWKSEHDRDGALEGKSPHKKGTEKYKKHMAAIHAGESTRVDELGRMEFIFDGQNTNPTIPEVPEGLFPEAVTEMFANKYFEITQGAAENYSVFTSYQEYIQNVLVPSVPFYIASPFKERVFKSQGPQWLPANEFPF